MRLEGNNRLTSCFTLRQHYLLLKMRCLNGLSTLWILTFLNFINVLKLYIIGLLGFLIPFLCLSQTALLRAAIIKSRFLNAMPMVVIVILNVSGIVSYISSLISDRFSLYITYTKSEVKASVFLHLVSHGHDFVLFRRCLANMMAMPSFTYVHFLFY